MAVGRPFTWVTSVGSGLGWQTEQATGLAIALAVAGFRWPWCAPTATVVAAVSPCVPTGGAAGSSVSVPVRMPARPAVP